MVKKIEGTATRKTDKNSVFSNFSPFSYFWVISGNITVPIGAEIKKMTFPMRANPAYIPACSEDQKCLTRIISVVINDVSAKRDIADGAP